MKVADFAFSILASVVTMGAALLRLSWHRKKEAPGPTPPQTSSQKFLRIAAGIWLLVMLLAITVVVVVSVVPGVIALFR